MTTSNEKLRILLIEGSARRLELLKEALSDAGTSCRLHAVEAESDAIMYLKKEDPFKSAPDPDLVLFDFSVADKDHLLAIEKLRNQAEMNRKPFAVLTRPESEKLLEAHYEDNQSNCVLFSPVELSEFLNTMNKLSIERFTGAVSLISNLGFVLVRVPTVFTRRKSVPAEPFAKAM